eukprot:TRINITY_DN6806_c0_g2_i2.p1 TRINITY_DN6806_c0_g2~~TRINITY_DN6806_c0_g2_i2.p1  ORF type:complete len:404 (+),score=20.06 TRINITY_DN6806_c0_g2_i2:182-1393(+)
MRSTYLLSKLFLHKNVKLIQRELGGYKFTRQFSNFRENNGVEIDLMEIINRGNQIEITQSHKSRVPCIEDGLTELERVLLFQLHKESLKHGEQEDFLASYICEGASQIYGKSVSGLYSVLNRLVDDRQNHIQLIETDGSPKRYGEQLILLNEKGRDIEELPSELRSSLPLANSNLIGMNPSQVRFSKVWLAEQAKFIFDFPEEMTSSSQALSCKFPYILCNPRFLILPKCQVICPAHHPTTVISATLEFMETNSLDECIRKIQAPCFAQESMILKRKLDQFYLEGRGQITQFASFELKQTESSHFIIEISGIPYSSVRHKVCQRIATLQKRKYLDGILAVYGRHDDGIIRVFVEEKYRLSVKAILYQMYMNSSINTSRNMGLYGRLANDEQRQGESLLDSTFS